MGSRVKDVGTDYSRSIHRDKISAPWSAGVT